jgi:hypothetical protein
VDRGGSVRFGVHAAEIKSAKPATATRTYVSDVTDGFTVLVQENAGKVVQSKRMQFE